MTIRFEHDLASRQLPPAHLVEETETSAPVGENRRTSSSFVSAGVGGLHSKSTMASMEAHPTSPAPADVKTPKTATANEGFFAAISNKLSAFGRTVWSWTTWAAESVWNVISWPFRKVGEWLGFVRPDTAFRRSLPDDFKKIYEPSFSQATFATVYAGLKSSQKRDLLETLRGLMKHERIRLYGEEGQAAAQVRDKAEYLVEVACGTTPLEEGEAQLLARGCQVFQHLKGLHEFGKAVSSFVEKLESMIMMRPTNPPTREEIEAEMKKRKLEEFENALPRDIVEKMRLASACFEAASGRRSLASLPEAEQLLQRMRVTSRVALLLANNFHLVSDKAARTQLLTLKQDIITQQQAYGTITAVDLGMMLDNSRYAKARAVLEEFLDYGMGKQGEGKRLLDGQAFDVNGNPGSFNPALVLDLVPAIVRVDTDVTTVVYSR